MPQRSRHFNPEIHIYMESNVTVTWSRAPAVHLEGPGYPKGFCGLIRARRRTDCGVRVNRHITAHGGREGPICDECQSGVEPMSALGFPSARSGHPCGNRTTAPRHPEAIIKCPTISRITSQSITSLLDTFSWCTTPKPNILYTRQSPTTVRSIK
jgi:hypothetical protein